MEGLFPFLLQRSSVRLFEAGKQGVTVQEEKYASGLYMMST